MIVCVSIASLKDSKIAASTYVTYKPKTEPTNFGQMNIGINVQIKLTLQPEQKDSRSSNKGGATQ